MPDAKGKYRGTVAYQLVYAELVAAARYRGVTTYQAIAQLIGLPLKGAHMGAELGHVLGEISEDELKQGRPMLSAIAVGVDGVPGSGFFVWARQLGRLASDRPEDELPFWVEEKEAVYETWKRVFKP